MDPNQLEFPSFIQQINALPPDPNNRTEDPGIAQLTMSAFYQQINALPFMDEKTRYNFIKANIDIISNQILDGSCKYFKKLLEAAFLNTYKEILITMPPTPTRTMALNKLAYSYRFMKFQDTGITKTFNEIASVVNLPAIQRLLSIGLEKEVACALSIARYSCLDEMTNVNRLNYEIYINGSHVMTEQKIIWIYEQLFDQMRYLFSATMLESKDTMQPGELCQVGHEEFEEAFSNASLALLTLVNNMPMESIDTLLHIFIEQWRSVGSPMTRFSLRALSGDHGRVRHVVETIEAKEKLFIP